MISNLDSVMLSTLAVQSISAVFYKRNQSQYKQLLSCFFFIVEYKLME